MDRINLCALTEDKICTRIWEIRVAVGVFYLPTSKKEEVLNSTVFSFMLQNFGLGEPIMMFFLIESWFFPRGPKFNPVLWYYVMAIK